MTIFTKKFMALNACIKKEKSSKFRNMRFHIRKLEEKGKLNPCKQKIRNKKNKSRNKLN